MIKARYEDTNDSQQDTEVLFDNKLEKGILVDFCNYVEAKDPDIIVFLGDHYANTILDYLLQGLLSLD